MQNSCLTSVESTTFVGNKNGAIRAYDGEALINNSRFRANGPAIVGGGLTITNSQLWGNATAIRIDDDFLASRILNTVVRDNSGSGIVSDVAGLTLANNVATGNGAYGINAPGAIDLGGNRASGNDAGQCVGVICTK